MTTITINIPSNEVGLFKKIAKKMGWTIERKHAVKHRLYDPETRSSKKLAATATIGRPRST